MTDWTEPTDEPLSPLLQREFFEAASSLGVALEAQIRGEAVTVTPEDMQRLLLTMVTTVHEHTLRLAMEIDRLKGIAK